ncbi:metal-sensitive transcriptional regulator [Jeotgalibacillus sp. R-1-5s-1]|uniref:metal-sensitive transcriptional regulator n=1 Tax=Jeotgalibacillus sp. R-1-5s-1 TaxID=2555897 RepID=UPI00106B815C|nr:metal-sensitive transcriptional regulator [Jeotgalibacillus sp. R-1-5s-1]TFD98381.1 metal-sensitive transcriptional regulator [Jeotgalibacillus sp. R-1-5s-1]
MDYPKETLHRMKRVEGQLRGVLSMMENGKDCKEVVTQLSAVRTAIDRTIGLVVSENLVTCVKEANETDGREPDELIKEAVNLLVKSR